MEKRNCPIKDLNILGEDIKRKILLKAFNLMMVNDMNIIMMGPPGAGKGTYSSRLSEEHGIPHIETGDIFRNEVEEGSELGKEIEGYMEKGDLVPDETVNDVVEKRLSKADCDDGYILDGYPRTMDQAKALLDFASIDLVLNIDVSKKVIVNRLSNRRICSECGEIYNLESLTPEEEGICDECGGELYQRDDDKPEVIENRLDEYESKSKPILEFYEDKVDLVNVVFDGETSVEDAIDKIKSKVNEFTK